MRNEMKSPHKGGQAASGGENYEESEEEIIGKESASQKKKKKMKVSGKSVFKLREIIKHKSQASKSK